MTTDATAAGPRPAKRRPNQGRLTNFEADQDISSIASLLPQRAPTPETAPAARVTPADIPAPQVPPEDEAETPAGTQPSPGTQGDVSGADTAPSEVPAPAVTSHTPGRRKRSMQPVATDPAPDTDDRVVWAQTNFSLPVDLIAKVRETREATGYPFDVLITQAIQSTYDRLPELLYPQGPPAAGNLFPRAVTRASRRSGGTYAQLTVRFPTDHLATVHNLARDLGASSSSHLVVTALQAYLSP